MLKLSKNFLLLYILMSLLMIGVSISLLLKIDSGDWLIALGCIVNVLCLLANALFIVLEVVIRGKKLKINEEVTIKKARNPVAEYVALMTAFIMNSALGIFALGFMWSRKIAVIVVWQIFIAVFYIVFKILYFKAWKK